MFHPTIFECLRVSSDIGNHFRIYWSYFYFFCSRFSFNASSDSSWKLLQTFPEWGMEVLVIHRTGSEALNSEPTSMHAQSSNQPLCYHFPGQLLTIAICFTGEWPTQKGQRSLRFYSWEAAPRTPKLSSYTAQPFDGSSFQLLFWTELDGSRQLWNEWLPTTNSQSFPMQNNSAF